jgi:predicted RNase H-like HicB family nuclease
MRYTVVLIPEEGETGRYVAYVPAIPGCVTYGDSIDDALAMAEDAAATMLASIVDHDEFVPTEPTGAVIASIGVRVPATAGATA